METKFSAEELDQLGRLADRLDAITYSVKLPLPPSIHIKGLLGTATDVRDELIAFVRERSPYDPWEGQHPKPKSPS